MLNGNVRKVGLHTAVDKSCKDDVVRWLQNNSKLDGSGVIRTHASEETGALNQRLGPLGTLPLIQKKDLLDQLAGYKPYTGQPLNASMFNLRAQHLGLTLLFFKQRQL